MMTNYQKHINALRKCAQEHENDITPFSHVIISDLCRDTANLLEALEQEPTTKNDLGVDTVSRKAVLNQIFYSTDNSGDVVLGSALRERIERLPSVTPIRPKGRWIDHSDEGYVECPRCGSATSCDGNIADLHFCFSCGAEMEEVKNGNDN